MTTTFESAVEGDKVWNFSSGWGVIVEVCEDFKYPIIVDFENGDGASYTFDGKEYKNDVNQSLFWDEIKFEVPKKPLPRLKVDTKVLVWADPTVKHKRHFSHFKNGKIYVFDNGSTSFSRDNEYSVTGWPNWELAE